jgi:hypothetical protein
MKKVHLGLVALAAIVGITSAFTTKDNKFAIRTYGVLSKSGSTYNVELFSHGICTSDAATVCSVRFNSPSTVTSIATSAAIPVDKDVKYLHTN